MCSSICKEDGIAGINKGYGLVQSGLPVSMVLTVSAFLAESPVFEGVGVCEMFPDAQDELVEGVRTWVGIHQWPQWCVGFFCNGYTEGSGKLSDERGWKDMWLIVKGEV